MLKILRMSSVLFLLLVACLTRDVICAALIKKSKPGGEKEKEFDHCCGQLLSIGPLPPWSSYFYPPPPSPSWYVKKAQEGAQSGLGGQLPPIPGMPSPNKWPLPNGWPPPPSPPPPPPPSLSNGWPLGPPN